MPKKSTTKTPARSPATPKVERVVPSPRISSPLITVDKDTWEREVEATARQTRLSIASELAEYSDYDVLKVRQFVDVLKVNDGMSTTPIEDFIVSLPWHWLLAKRYGDALTPDDIIDDLINGPDGCRSWFDDVVLSTRYFNRMYPKLIAVDQAEEGEKLA